MISLSVIIKKVSSMALLADCAKRLNIDAAVETYVVKVKYIKSEDFTAVELFI
jgi:hypothetical protein